MDGDVARLQTIMTSYDRTPRSEKICAGVVHSASWQKAKSILLFSPLRSEPQIARLETAAMAAGKSTAVISAILRVESDLNLSSAPELVLVPEIAFSGGRRLDTMMDAIISN